MSSAVPRVTSPRNALVLEVGRILIEPKAGKSIKSVEKLRRPKRQPIRAMMARRLAKVNPPMVRPKEVLRVKERMADLAVRARLVLER